MKFGEVLTAMVTPFTSDGELNVKGVYALVKHLICDSHGLVILGTTGESPTLTETEKLSLVEEVCRVREEVSQDFTLLVGSGSYSTRESISFTEKLAAFPIDGIMLVVPYYNRPTQGGLQRHFTAVASETHFPVILYNVPVRTGCNMEAETVIRLSEIPNIVAVKEASGNLNQISKICQGTGEEFSLYSGDDSLTLPILSVGGKGIISVAAHLVGRQIRRLITAFKRGDVEEATALHGQLLPFFFQLFSSSNPIPVKEALNLLGISVGPPRSPLTRLNQEERKRLQILLDNHKGAFIPCKGIENNI